MEGTKLLSGSSVGQRFKTLWVLRRLPGEHVRNATMNILLTTLMADVAGYGQLRAAANQGQLPWFTPDVLLISLALVEAAAVLAWAAACQQRRRAVLLGCTLVSFVSSILLFTFPSLAVATPPELCSSGTTVVGGNEGVSGATVWRALAAALVGLAGAAARGGLWVHGLMLIEEQKPLRMSLHYGILVTARVVSYVMVPKLLADMAQWQLALGMVVLQLVNLLQLQRIPADLPPRDEYHDYRMLSSVGRVLCNGVATAQMVAFGLLCAALWNYGWNESELFKTLYLMKDSKHFLDNQFTLFLYHAVVAIVVLYGIFYGPPKSFELASVGKIATGTSLLLAALYGLTSLLVTCERGLVAGLAADNYTQPICSQNCGCAVPQSEFAPVCVPDSLTTYMSPCHAGCSGAEQVNGVTVYTNCACAPTTGMQRAVGGACSYAQCTAPYQLQRVITVMIVTFTLLALQSLGVSVLKGVQPRDRPPALALSAALALLFTFGAAHPISIGLQVWQCVWSVNDVCYLRGGSFPVAVTALSAGLAGAAFALVVACQCALGRRRAPEPPAVAIELDATQAPQTQP